VQAYLQQYPYASGPDEAMNERCLEEVRRKLTIRPRADDVDVTQLAPADCELDADARHRFESMAQDLGLSSTAIDAAIDDLGWKVSRVPRDAARVLSVGCGDGRELLLLRAVLPDAIICAHDWHDGLLPNLQAIADVRFREVNLADHLDPATDSYDVVFSNHVIEHMYDPVAMLRSVSTILRPGGALVTALPLDAGDDVPFVKELVAVADNPATLHRLDLHWVAAGHPWKTNAPDVCAALREADLRPRLLLQRSARPSRYYKGNRGSYSRSRAIRLAAFRATFGMLNRTCKMVMARPPEAFVRAWFAVQSRTSIGINRLRNDFSDELLFVAERPA
jgi:2-polyprenyl-3-methyl-5-hydroxy-6-metoxy-1,4-benzoquinol methylase